MCREIGLQLPEAAVVKDGGQPVIPADGQMHAAVGADILAFDPDLTGSPPSAVAALGKLGLLPNGPGVPQRFVTKAALPDLAGQQISDISHTGPS